VRQFLRSKIHRATITHTDLHYEGSLTLDRDLMDAASIADHEVVHVVNVNNGERFTTYAIEGARGSGIVGLNVSDAYFPPGIPRGRIRLRREIAKGGRGGDVRTAVVGNSDAYGEAWPDDRREAKSRVIRKARGEPAESPPDVSVTF
jgi:hypothetical protein